MRKDFKEMLERVCVEKEVQPQDVLNYLMEADGEEKAEDPFAYILMEALKAGICVPTFILGCGSLCMAAYKMLEEKYGSEKKNKGFRTSINKVADNIEELNFMLAEGNVRAFQIIKEIDAIAQGIFKEQVIPEIFGGHFMPALNTKLGMDDMNIRGQQLVYAEEYCDGDIPKLCRYLQQRNNNMVSYINKKTAQDFEKDKYDFYIMRRFPIAVSGGASSTSEFEFSETFSLMMNRENYKKFLESEVEKETIDYSSMDITSGTPKDTALKISEAHGFELQSRIGIMSGYDRNFEHILMLNTETGDILEACALDDDFCYGGCNVLAPRKGNVKRAIFRTEPGFRGNSERFENGSDYSLYDCSYQEGVFKQLAVLPENKMEDIDLTGYPIAGVVSLPVPEFLNGGELELFVHHTDMTMHLQDDGWYMVSKIINALYMRENWDEWMTEKLEPFYRCWKENFANAMIEYTYLGNMACNPYCVEKAFQFASAFTGISAKDLEKPIKDYLIKWVEEHQHLGMDKDGVIERIKRMKLTPDERMIREADVIKKKFKE